MELSCLFFSGACGSPCTLTEGWWGVSQERARLLQWMSRGTLGRAGWGAMGVELPLWCSCENSRDAWSSWDGYGAGLEPVVRICGQYFGGCLLLPSHGRSTQGFLQTSGGNFAYAHDASCGRLQHPVICWKGITTDLP